MPADARRTPRGAGWPESRRAGPSSAWAQAGHAEGSRPDQPQGRPNRYDKMRFGDLPVLTNALEEAGRAKGDLPTPCRGAVSTSAASGSSLLGRW